MYVELSRYRLTQAVESQGVYSESTPLSFPEVASARIYRTLLVVYVKQGGHSQKEFGTIDKTYCALFTKLFHVLRLEISN